MKKGEKKQLLFSEAQAKRWLSWIAKNMLQDNYSIFLIEQMQVSWLPSRFMRILHWTLSILLSGLIFCFVYGILFEILDFSIQKIVLGFREGALVGIILGLGIGVIYSIDRKRLVIETTRVTWSWNHFQNKYKTGFKNGLIPGLLAGVLFGIIDFFLENSSIEGLYHLLAILVMGLSLSLTGGLIGMFTSGFRKKISEKTTYPNEGIKTTFQNSIIYGLLIMLISLIIISFSFSLTEGIRICLVIGPFAILWLGGMNVIRHYVLRGMVYLSDFSPRNYIDFLDYSVYQLGFLQRVGGGYIFIHRMLMEHFAEMEKEVSL